MQQLSIFDVFDDIEKEIRIQDILVRVKEFNPNFKVAAVYIPSPDMSQACCSFVVNDNGYFRHFMILHGHFVDRSHPLIDKSPQSLNKHWTMLN